MAEHIIIVVGGGIVGSSAAYRLARRGVRVTLVDRTDSGHATAAGAGIVAPATSLHAPAAWYPLAFRAVAYYPELVACLEGDGVSATGYAVVGALFVATDGVERQQLPETYRLIEEHRRAGVGNIEELSMLDRADSRSLFPPLAPDVTGIHLPGAGRVNGRTLRDAMQQAAQHHGAAVRRAPAELVTTARGAAGVRVDGELVSADAVILATGAWEDGWASQLGIAIPLAPQRGQILHLDLAGTDTSRWPVVVGFTDPYMLAFPEHRVVAGATREDGTGFDYRVTAAGQAELLSKALVRAPGIGPATVVETRVGFRPFVPDRLPVLGQVPGCHNVWLATGLGASGLTLGPYAGAAIADMACGEETPHDMAPYDPARVIARTSAM
ncbi:MAG: NAD(P)/FAD-dependent oxidoreductase [Streptosporangiales bacterium]